MKPIVPSLEDNDLIKIIEAIEIDSPPIYVTVKPDKNSIIDECYKNVAEKVRNEGGFQVIGWQIWKTKNLIEAEFHSIWKSSDGEFIDITPKQALFHEILFIEDKKRFYDGCQVDNIRINISGNLLVDDLISVCEILFKIENKGSRVNEYQISLVGEELLIWKILQQMKSGLSLMLSQGLTKNQMCFCGSNKYRKCHGRFLTCVQERLNQQCHSS